MPGQALTARCRGSRPDRAVGLPLRDGRERGERVAHILERLPASGRPGDDPRAFQPRDQQVGERAGLLVRDALALKLQGEGGGPRLQRAGRGRPQVGETDDTSLLIGNEQPLAHITGAAWSSSRKPPPGEPAPAAGAASLGRGEVGGWIRNSVADSGFLVFEH